MRRLFPLLLLVALPVWAQSGKPADLQPLPAVPPPPPEMQPFDAALEPQVTIIRNDKETREEFRVNGRLYMIKVTPRIGKPYYLVDPHGDGRFVRHDSFDKRMAVPTWVLKTW